jgi:DNA polymerase delta subunit 4
MSAKKLSEMGDRFQYQPSSTAEKYKMSRLTPTKVNELFKVQKSSQSRKLQSLNKHAPEGGSLDESDREVHELETLRQFDLDATYGPCTGLSRLERFTRAEKFGFSPPTQIYNLILNHPLDVRYTQNVWYDAKI